jgi:dUTP pyrophosphatase
VAGQSASERKNMTVKVEFKKLYPDAQLPKKAHLSDAGFDLFAYLADDEHPICLYPGDRALISVGFTMALPPGHCAFVCPRSGLAVKNGISVLNSPGVIDESFRGPVGVILVNHGQDTFIVSKNMRIAQMVIQKLPEIEVLEVEELTPATERGIAGFGSTGT